jgi:DNA replication protein
MTEGYLVADERERESVGQPSSRLIEQIISEVWDPLEAKAILTLALLGGTNQPVTETDILSYPALVTGARGDGSARETHERIRPALGAAVARGILIALRDEQDLLWYVVATDQTRRLASSGDFRLAIADSEPTPRLRTDRPDVFGLYEQNIGVVSPIMADRLNEALNIYPEEWLRDAIGEAVSYNKRNWRYIQAILENWTREGRSDETNRRNHEEHLDPEKYLRGKYAALFRRR